MDSYSEVREIIERHRAELEVLRNVLEGYEYMLRESERLESSGVAFEFLPDGSAARRGGGDFPAGADCRRTAA